MARWLVKLARGDWETVLSEHHERQLAVEAADVLNHRYQTDEYYVEAFDPIKAREWGRG